MGASAQQSSRATVLPMHCIALFCMSYCVSHQYHFSSFLLILDSSIPSSSSSSSSSCNSLIFCCMLCICNFYHFVVTVATWSFVGGQCVWLFCLTTSCFVVFLLLCRLFSFFGWFIIQQNIKHSFRVIIFIIFNKLVVSASVIFTSMKMDKESVKMRKFWGLLEVMMSKTKSMVEMFAVYIDVLFGRRFLSLSIFKKLAPAVKNIFS